MWIGTGPDWGLDGTGEPEQGLDGAGEPERELDWAGESERELDWAGGSLPFRPNCAVWVEISNKPARDSLPFS